MQKKIEKLSKEITILQNKLKFMKKEKVITAKHLRMIKNSMVLDYIRKYFSKLENHCFYDKENNELVKFSIAKYIDDDHLKINKLIIRRDSKFSMSNKIFSIHDYNLLSTFQSYKMRHVNNLTSIKKKVYCWKMPIK